MPYWTKEWNLYTCRFVISSKTIEHTDQGSFLVEESYGLQVELFESDHPEAAYEYACAMIPRLHNGYRNDEGQEVQDRCLGINDLDLLQENMTSLKEIFSKKESLHLTMFSVKEIQKKPEDLVRKKEEFSLFDKC